MHNLAENMQQLVDEAAEAKVEFLVCANTPINTADDIKASVEVLNKTDETCKKAGIGFAYHNHDAEFREVEGQLPYQAFLTQTKIKMELDLAWATKAKQDPVELFKLHPGRYPLWHAKDLDKVNMNPAEVGSGVVDFKHIFDNAKLSGMKYFFVEQDGAPQPLQNVTNSFNYLKKLLQH